MNNDINTEKIEKLEKLKAQQEKIEKELQLQEELSKNDKKKFDAVEKFKQGLASKVESHKRKVAGMQKYIEQFRNLVEEQSVNLKVECFEKEITHTPWTYIVLENGEDERWQGEPLTETVREYTMYYKGHPINFEMKYKRNRPRYSTRSEESLELKIEEKITGSYTRTYKRAKTVINKIDEYETRLEHERKAKQKTKEAVADAKEYLKYISPEASKVTHDITTKSRQIGGYRSGTYVVNNIIVDLPNGNQVSYKVSRNYSKDAKETFNLSLIKFVDKTINTIRTNPEKLISRLS